MTVLGIYPAHDSGAAIIDMDGSVLAAVNEGRLTGEKLQWGFPDESIEEVQKIADVSPREIEYVAIGGLFPGIGQWGDYENVPPKKRFMELLSYVPLTGSRGFSKLGRWMFSVLYGDQKFVEKVREHSIDAPISSYDHHFCHAASAYYTSPFDSDTVVVTADGQGDFRSGTVYSITEDDMLELEAWTPFFHSMGKYWSFVTFNLGFTPLRHEGKINGLAAFGDPDQTIDVFRRFMNLGENGCQFRSDIGCWNNPMGKRLHDALRGHRREDIAAGLQRRTEEVVTRLVKEAVYQLDVSNVALAGGLFANVKLNQEILKLDAVDDVYIHPNMGDGGLGMGAAYAKWAEIKSENDEACSPRFLQTVYHGPSYSHQSVRDALESSSLEYEERDDFIDRVGQYLADGYVVGRYSGALEYGPRALGNRSILVAPTDESMQDWLNQRLDRTEFMPFAPSILQDHIDDYFQDVSNGTYAGRFMTINFDASELAKESAPAVVHLDGTARPQIVRREDNPNYYDIIHSFYEKTGIPIVVNTSFNAHGKPIVNKPEDAIKELERGMVDVLSIENFVVRTEMGPSVSPKPIELDRPRPKQRREQ